MLFDWYKTQYKAENTINIKPVISKHEMLILPLQMPKEYTECEKWFKDVHYKRRKIHWTVQVSGVGDFYLLKKYLYQWNESHKGYMTFDKIKAKRVARFGWFKNHSELHGHQDMRQYLDGKRVRANVALEYEIFTWYVWNGPPPRRPLLRLLSLILMLNSETGTWSF